MNLPSEKTIRGEYVEAIERYGYTPTEARFLYLVATHSGYFTQQQFFRFAGVQRGGMGTRLTAKAMQHGHIRTARLARHTLIYNLFSRPFYESIEKDNLRNRRRLSDELIRTRLLILDFVLAHPVSPPRNRARQSSLLSRRTRLSSSPSTAPDVQGNTITVGNGTLFRGPLFHILASSRIELRSFCPLVCLLRLWW